MTGGPVSLGGRLRIIVFGILGYGVVGWCVDFFGCLWRLLLLVV